MLLASESKKDQILVCLPTYHSPKEWIERAINSIAQQTYTNFECWIVKDGCKKACSFNPNYTEKTCIECSVCEETKIFCNKKIKEDKRFKFYSMPINFGAAGWGPRNFIISNTDQDYIAYLDDDNWYEPDHLKCLFNSIKKTNSDMAYTGTNVFDKNLNLIETRIHNSIPKKGYIDTSEIMHKRKLIERFGGWRYVEKCNDWDIIERWLPDLSWSHTNKVTLNFYLRENCGIHRQ